MSGLHNFKLPTSAYTTFELRHVRSPTRALIRLNREIDPKFGFEQTIVAREIAHGHYVNADDLEYDQLPDQLFKRMSFANCEAILSDGRIRIDTFALDPRINAADLLDTPDSPYILALNGQDGMSGLPITIGRRALVFRAWLDPYARLRQGACLSIDDTDRFVSCVTRKLEQVLSHAGSRIIRVLHAPCVYQWSRILGTRAGRGDESDSSADPEDAKYFIKPGYGFHDAEFRFVWILDQDFEGHVDIQCPELLSCCSLFSDHVR